MTPDSTSGPPRPDATSAFVVLEGIDGSGSTTQAELLATALRGEGRRVLLTHEPSDGPVGGMIRLALSGRLVGASGARHGEGDAGESPEVADIGVSRGLDRRTLALLFAADRADHVATEVRPALADGRTVVCDRYLLSSLVYQGLDLDLEWVRTINRAAERPDLTVFVDVSAEHAIERMARDRWTREMWEDAESLRRLRVRYRELIDRGVAGVGPVVTVDGSGPREAVAETVLEAVRTHVGASG